MIKREIYLKQLRSFKEKQLIKVITGIRRCGKSTLLEQFTDELKQSGVDENRIIFINFEDLRYESLLDYRKLYEYIDERLEGSDRTYIFLDEIQKVRDFQKAVDSLYIKKNTDIYITGSNSDLLSSELSTLLTGRYVEIKMFPLSFKEYCGYFNNKDKRECFRRYLETGAMPYVINFDEEESINIYLEGICNTILNNDVLKRYPQTDIVLLESILRFLAQNTGNFVSSNKIADTLTSYGRKTTYNTVEKYIRYLKEAFFIYECKRFDLKGKQLLKSLSKYYFIDNGIRNMMLSSKGTDIGHVLENVVYLELLRRYDNVNVGKYEAKEVDFIVKGKNGYEYYQVAATLLDDKVKKREIEALKLIKDNYPKIILTFDDIGLGDEEGIKIKNIIDFLLE